MAEDAGVFTPRTDQRPECLPVHGRSARPIDGYFSRSRLVLREVDHQTEGLQRPDPDAVGRDTSLDLREWTNSRQRRDGLDGIGNRVTCKGPWVESPLLRSRPPLVVASGTPHVLDRAIRVVPGDQQIALVRTRNSLGSASTSSGCRVTQLAGAASGNGCEQDVARRGPRGGSEGSPLPEARRSARSGPVPARGHSGHALTTRPSART